jgi:hypothetical protein
VGAVRTASVGDVSISIPSYLQQLVDDAAIFPPGNAPLAEAVIAHRNHRRADHGALVGPFVVSDTRLPELIKITTDGSEPLAVTVVVTGGAGALEPAAKWAARAGSLDLRGLEIALRDEDDLAHNARRIVIAVDQLVASGDLDDEVPVYVEAPRLYGADPSHGWLSALDEIAARDHRLKLRTGGESADAFPAAAELSMCIEQALDRELRFKCTAGLHHALRHRDAETGFEHHGFLNVLLATRSSLDGDGRDGVVEVLNMADADAVRSRVLDAGDQALVSARHWFTSFGSCSVSDPLNDLVSLRVVRSFGGQSTTTT